MERQLTSSSGSENGIKLSKKVSGLLDTKQQPNRAMLEVEETKPTVLHTVQVAVVVHMLLVVMVQLLLVDRGVLENKFQQCSKIQQDRVLLETLGV